MYSHAEMMMGAVMFLLMATFSIFVLAHACLTEDKDK